MERVSERGGRGTKLESTKLETHYGFAPPMLFDEPPTNRILAYRNRACTVNLGIASKYTRSPIAYTLTAGCVITTVGSVWVDPRAGVRGGFEGVARGTAHLQTGVVRVQGTESLSNSRGSLEGTFDALRFASVSFSSFLPPPPLPPSLSDRRLLHDHI